MKYLVASLLVLPLITSCVEETTYYEPPARVEVHPVYPNRHFHENTESYGRPGPDVLVTHHHSADVNQNSNRIIINSPDRQVHQQENVHEYRRDHSNRERPAPVVQQRPQQTIHVQGDVQAPPVVTTEKSIEKKPLVTLNKVIESQRRGSMPVSRDSPLFSR